MAPCCFVLVSSCFLDIAIIVLHRLHSLARVHILDLTILQKGMLTNSAEGYADKLYDKNFPAAGQAYRKEDNPCYTPLMCSDYIK